MRLTALSLICFSGLLDACAVVPQEHDSVIAERWRVSSIETAYASGKRTHSAIAYDSNGRRVSLETTGDDAADRRTVLYRHDSDGNVDLRIDVEPDDLERYRFRVREDGQIELRLRDGNGDGRFGSYVRYVFDEYGRATRREYRRLDGQRADVHGTEGELLHVASYQYRDGRLSIRSMDREADGDVNELMFFHYEDDGRLMSITVQKDDRIDRTSMYTYARGPCDTGNLIPEARSFCVDDGDEE